MPRDTVAFRAMCGRVDATSCARWSEMMQVAQVPAYRDVVTAGEVLTGVALVTPVFRDDRLDSALGAQVYVKAEFLQGGGSFKVRGIYNKLTALGAEERSRGVVTASFGSAGLATALAARMLRVSSTIVMPSRPSEAKRAAIEQAGGQVILHGTSTDQMLAEALAISTRDGCAFIHPFDQPEVIAGQGTIGIELDGQVGELDTILIPAGGGGLLAGVGLALRELRPQVEVIGVEPAGANSVGLSLQNHRVTEVPQPSSVAEGLAVKRCGRMAFELIQRNTSRVLTVGDSTILEAVRMFRQFLNVEVEPAGAVGLAAMLTTDEYRGKRVAVIASGANLEPTKLDDAIAAIDAAAVI
jgi:threonine dehydratase